MSAEDRETLSLSLTQGHSLWTLATVFVRAPSTVSREYTRNSVRRPYHACTAYALAAATGLGKTRRGKGAKILANMNRHRLLLSVSAHAANHYEVTLVQLNEDG